ncbi:hypothetical protein PWT90_06308 [Aphanocladium album]|nr:hypothetical protein PWT90_06308 [Aphanocladium album]
MASDEWAEYLIKAGSKVKNPSDYGYHHGPFDSRRRLRISVLNTMVCDVVVPSKIPGTVMCGRTFATKGNLYRHLRNIHNIDLQTPNGGCTTKEQVAGESAIRKLVLYGGWRSALYRHEPSDLSEKSLIYEYACWYKDLAAEDEDFRDRYGSALHRKPLSAASPSSASSD